MPSRDDPYSRLYHKIKDEYPHVYDDDRSWAAYTRLLMLADASWPLRPPVPASTNRKALAVLAGAGLVIIDRDSYTIRGLEKLRTEKRDAARNAAVQRWHSASNADASDTRMPTRPAPTRPDPNQADPTSGARDADLADTWWTLTGKYPTGRLLPWLDEIGNEFGHERASAVMAEEHLRDATSNTLASRTKDRLNAEKRASEKAAERRERDRLAEFAARRPKVDPEEQKARLKAMLPEKFAGGRAS